MRKREKSDPKKSDAEKSSPQADGEAGDEAVGGNPMDPKPAMVVSPSFDAAFALIGTIRLVSACYNTISECDETFNYWEPTHYLIYGFGFQVKMRTNVRRAA
jgi:alpha-1,2-mannosyltransferase